MISDQFVHFSVFPLFNSQQEVAITEESTKFRAVSQAALNKENKENKESIGSVFHRLSSDSS